MRARNLSSATPCRASVAYLAMRAGRSIPAFSQGFAPALAVSRIEISRDRASGGRGGWVRCDSGEQDAAAEKIGSRSSRCATPRDAADAPGGKGIFHELRDTHRSASLRQHAGRHPCGSGLVPQRRPPWPASKSTKNRKRMEEQRTDDGNGIAFPVITGSSVSLRSSVRESVAPTSVRLAIRQAGAARRRRWGGRRAPPRRWSTWRGRRTSRPPPSPPAA
jgi:hypothetical protein